MSIYTQEDYEKLGEELGLELIGYAPVNVFEKAEWKCKRCERILHKNRRSLMYGKYPCPCKRSDTLDESSYTDLAKKLDIVWEGKHLPLNNKAVTQWRVSMTDIYFGASYHQLSYGNGVRFKALINRIQEGESYEDLAGLIYETRDTL